MSCMTWDITHFLVRLQHRKVSYGVLGKEGVGCMSADGLL